jgi:hypothetical protein
MNKVIISIGLVLLCLNSLIGILISNYLSFNWITADIVILVNTLLIFEVSKSKRNDGFKIGLSFFYSLLTFILIALAILSPCRFRDNYYLIVIVFLTFLEFALWGITSNIKSINSKS